MGIIWILFASPVQYTARRGCLDLNKGQGDMTTTESTNYKTEHNIKRLLTRLQESEVKEGLIMACVYFKNDDGYDADDSYQGGRGNLCA